jgi:N-acetylneuraminic acid mutarotase
MIDRRRLLSFSVVPFAGAFRTASAQNATADWRRVSTGEGVEPRWDHTLSALPGTSELLLAFGRNANESPLGDAWVADRSTGEWELVESAGPSPRFGHAVATDSERGKVFLFGGEADGSTFFADLWSFDVESRAWELVHDGSGGPAARYGTALVFDGESTLFMLHGFTFEGRFDDVWKFDLNASSWEQVQITSSTAPLRRCLHEAVWSKSRGRIYLYGGCSSGYGPCPQGDLWKLDPNSGSWREIGSVAPAGRMNPALVMDDRSDRLVLFGGLTDNGASSDLWFGDLDGNDVRWSTVDSGDAVPSARSSHDSVLSAGAIYLFGGTGVDGVTSDLWRLKYQEAE